MTFKKRSPEEIEALKKLIPIGSMVIVIHPIEDVGDGWKVIPYKDSLNPIDYTIPEGYTFGGGGRVTDITRDDTRSLEGANPLVVQWYMYLEVNEEDWKTV